jgi:hypothetical protein
MSTHPKLNVGLGYVGKSQHNATQCQVFLCQPCNQGIIRTPKGHNLWHNIQWYLKARDKGKEPWEEVDALMAIRWVIDAWKSNVKKNALVNCFRKGCALLFNDEQLDDKEEPDEAESDLDSRHAYSGKV